jgi:hypothetical protein
LLIIPGVLEWYCFASLHVLVIVRKIGRKSCSELDLQFLDDTVASTELKQCATMQGAEYFVASIVSVSAKATTYGGKAN